MRRRRFLSLPLLLAGLAPLGCKDDVPKHREPTRENLIAAAREVMAAARYCSLITVDADGRPRARTMAPFPAEKGLIVWMATRPVTRKVAELKADPRATLHYFDKERLEYVLLTGSATLVDDLYEKDRHSHLITPSLYPNFPDGILLIRFEPETVEVIGRGIRADADTWKPPVVEFPAPASKG